jgi:hypothetical protein
VIRVTTDERLVIVLGRARENARPASFVARAAERDIPLVVLTVGYPVTERQQRFVAEAVGLAFDARVNLDAWVIATLEQIPQGIRPRDEVTIVAAGREERRIGSVLGRLPS